MQKRTILEIIPLSLFLVFGTLMHLKISMPYANWVTVISISLLSMLNFYGAYWLFNTTGLPGIARIMSGLVFSINNIACLYAMLHWQPWRFFSIISFITLGILFLVSLLSPKREIYKPIWYRCVVYIVVLSALFTYRILSAS